MSLAEKKITLACIVGIGETVRSILEPSSTRAR